ncbi:GNAT family N-acetyltransferase [Roseibium salinum]|uniref:GNAT family N-acetyltransferase n=1 Tax=Roseibium salinum TaxID=1604349 RepID=A0ABT3QY99_9HYPH|nr:GNAT family N-acetyltransferase [Roseibium sp. DSM 29163]MCX2721911.1 GNAT family N-acetyltransferase [Roseibium sp. DSM 29163]MDN3720048.1 GNAT family N-acetyltransferase [Roseibium salinum]
MSPTEDLSRNLAVKWAAFDELSNHDVHDLLRLRQTVFIMEQNSLYADIDGKDTAALHCHIRNRDTGALVGAIRLFTDAENGEARIGRVVIAQEARGAGLGRAMMQAGIEQATRLVPGCRLHVTAQAHLEPFYRSLGFEPASQVYIQDGIAHIDMIRTC